MIIENFPALELETIDCSHNDHVKGLTQYLKMSYELEFSEKFNRHDLGNVVHSFSHIRKVHHIEWIR